MTEMEKGVLSGKVCQQTDVMMRAEGDKGGEWYPKGLRRETEGEREREG